MIRYEQQQHFVVGALTLASVLGVVVALGVAMTCIAAVRRIMQVLPPSTPRRADVRFWYSMAAVLMLLAAWRGLGGEAAIQAFGRATAHAGAWYDERRLSQGIIVSLLLIGGGASMLALLRLLGGRRNTVILAALATTGLTGLTILRMISLHLVDWFLYTGIGPLRMNWMLEGTFYFIIAAAAVHTIRTTHAPRRRRRSGGTDTG